MPYTKTVWVDNTTPVDAAKMNNIENGIAGLSAPAPNATPPASPADGDIWYYPFSGGGAWQFRYNAAAPTYKWEFIGGQPWITASGADPGTQVAGWHELPTPAVTIPRNGWYLVETSIDQGSTGAAGLMAQGPNVAGQPSPAVYSQFYADSANVCGWAPIKGTMLISAGAVLKVFGYSANGNWTVNNRWICVTPLVVS
jgi:hypothetical protein